METKKLDRYLVGKCNCMTKTPEIEYHDELCYYRLKTEKENEKKYKSPSLAVDIIIINEEGKIVLIERKNPPYGWALPGGFVDVGETLMSAAIREAKEETCVEVKILDSLGIYDDPNRDPRQHVISAVFIGTAYKQTPKAADDAKNLGLYALNELPDLAFDHNKILEDFRQWAVK